MQTSSRQTRFAPADRSSLCTLVDQSTRFASQSFARTLLDAIPGPFLILNRNRQIVLANHPLQQLIGAAKEEAILGQRPGEALGCLQAPEAPGGCGTGEACRTCGAVLAILDGLAGSSSTYECRLSRAPGGHFEALDLRVSAVPLDYEGERFTILTVADISHEKRRRALEHVFFHDVLNLLGSIRGFAELLRDYDPDDKREIFLLMYAAAQQTIEEIEAQKLLAAAETRELKVRPERLSLSAFLKQTVDIYRFHEVAHSRQLVLTIDAEEIFESDRVLLGRILGNMIKNALEATRPGETVTVGGRRKGERIELWVHNPGGIPESVKQQLFQRSFSTKGGGRGLGTYSMKLLSEYLNGEVTFFSSVSEGTTFRAWCPVNL